MAQFTAGKLGFVRHGAARSSTRLLEQPFDENVLHYTGP